MSTEVADIHKFVEVELDELHKEMSNIRGQCQARRKVSSPTSTSYTSVAQGSPSLKVSKLDTFNGVQNATIVENFLFGLERCFDALEVSNDSTRINNAPPFLRDVA